MTPDNEYTAHELNAQIDHDSPFSATMDGRGDATLKLSPPTDGGELHDGKIVWFLLTKEQDDAVFTSEFFLPINEFEEMMERQNLEI